MKLLSLLSIALVIAVSAFSVAAAPPVQAEGAIRWLQNQVAAGNLVAKLPDHYGLASSAWEEFLSTRGPGIIESHLTARAHQADKATLLRITSQEETIVNLNERPMAKEAAEKLVQRFAADNAGSSWGGSLRLGRG
ncbi:hypothetical protein PSEUBRA_005344 [Kalmanozyma brasiliensis GHG001]|uniref:uncharacterized protein n=1 Tax=Kalmanozyma brasiliensis (strain GHG001) TaxID=1365824 RepID=UPI0028681368|nr:uncharacterized protein PSEUBRA_005344 [Kalmanozyma brasiliensis GHG001]KAF6767514.1 hypothetical protein PSEUBRA_005344 [Kalmanozyma brasiliensis GHG001]